MNGRVNSGPAGAAAEFAGAAEAAIADLEQRIPEGMGPLERAQAARIRDALRRLGECVAKLSEDELVVRGSMGQQRAHPLLKVEHDLRHEVTKELKELVFRAEQRGMYERSKACHAAFFAGEKDASA